MTKPIEALTPERKELLEKRVLASLYNYLQNSCNYMDLQETALKGANDLLAVAAVDQISIGEVSETTRALYDLADIIKLLRPLAVISGQIAPTHHDLSDEE